MWTPAPKFALIVDETHSAAVAKWYASSRAERVSAGCCVPEFASALGIKRRTSQLDAEQARQAWQRFERLVGRTTSSCCPSSPLLSTGPL